MSLVVAVVLVLVAIDGWFIRRRERIRAFMVIWLIELVLC
jgi:hypothetical protein